jgi:hypothetical protein
MAVNLNPTLLAQNVFDLSPAEPSEHAAHAHAAAGTMKLHRLLLK